MGTFAVLVLLFLGLMLLSIHVGTAIFLVAWISDFISTQILPQLASTLIWNTMTDYVLVAIPLFIMVGEVLLRSGLTDRMYSALALWMNRLPGGLLHTNIAACTLFSATSGSSVATAATVGTVALPSLRSRGYNERLTLGSIAAGGTLGILIPPSINMIIYAAMTDASIGRLFAAGVVPGIALAVTMSGLIALMAIMRPSIAGRPDASVTFSEKVKALPQLLPVFIVFGIIIGSIYAGIATPTESAGLALITALALAGLTGRLSVGMINDAARATIRTTAMVLLILVAAFILNFMLGLLGLPQQMSTWVRDLELSPEVMIWAIVLFYLVLGCFLEAVSMMVITIGVVGPLAVSLGFDLVWFGIFMILMMELALITPPNGLNLYVIQSIRKDGGGVLDVFVGVIPFVGAMILMVGLLIYFPQIALWLPDLLFGASP